MPSDMQAPPPGPEDSRPVPDPTTLTTAALYREIAQLREFLLARFDGEGKLTAEKFARLSEHAVDVERQRIEHKADAQEAIGAALTASERAVQEAFEAREKALAAALDSKDKAVAAAFEASEKAIAKAEVSIEKRADATYVALGELQRLLSQLMPRAEAENRFTNQDQIIKTVVDKALAASDANSATIVALERRTADSFASLGSRLDLIKGSSQGAAALYGYLVGAVFLVIAVVSFLTR